MQENKKIRSVNFAHKTTNNRIYEIEKEFYDGYAFIQKYPKSVSFFGSARTPEGDPHYEKARSVAKRIVTELGFAIATGGGPGIMEAANRGAYEAKGSSLGLNIELPSEQIKNKYLTDTIDFYYFFIRKVILSFSAEAYIFSPGGYGTLDEFFETVTLMQTGKIPHVPIILIGNDFWQPLHDFIKKELYEKHNAIDEVDMDFYTITEDEEEILEIVRNAPVRTV